MTQTEYKTVFEIGLRSFPWSEFLTPSVLAILGFILFRFFKRELARVVGGVMFAVGAFALAYLSATAIPHYLEVRRAYVNGKSSVVEGPIENFQPMPYLGPARESFSVEGVNFSYSPLDSGPCFADGPPHKGPIRSGQFVRIHYDNGCIQRLEIQTVSVPTAAERSEFASAEQARRAQFLETNAGVYRMNLAVAFVALIISLCWNLDWRHYIRYWLRGEPPYSRSWIIGLRCFFFLTLVGAFVQTLRLVTEPSRTSADFEKAGLLSLFGFGFFVLLDLFFRRRFRTRTRTFERPAQLTSEK